MAKRIALFNHKGGVSKTTTTFNLGWMLAEMGHTVVLVDADPQCNLTGLVLGYTGRAELEDFYREFEGRTLLSGLAPAFESQPVPIQGIECFPLENKDGMFLLPGHIRIAEYEVTLGIAQELSGAVQALRNIPGSINYLLDRTAELHAADYVLVDMSPGLGSINQNLLATADYFIVPTSPDFFSVMAIDSLARVLPGWQKWARQAHGLDALRTAAYPFPEPTAKFLGTIVQNYRPRGGEPAAAFRRWVDVIDERVDSVLATVLDEEGMLLPDPIYEVMGLERGHCLARISDFNSLIAKSQQWQTPVYALSQEQMGQGGKVYERSARARDAFLATFKDLAEKVIALTGS